MFAMTAKQKLLLKGLAEITAAAWTLDHSDEFSIADHNRLVRLRRAGNALARDCIQATRTMTPADQRAWSKLVLVAKECCTADQAVAFSRALELRFDPSPGEVDTQTTLPGMG